MRPGSWRGGAIAALACASCFMASAAAAASRSDTAAEQGAATAQQAATGHNVDADSLYVRMGGAAVVRAVVSDTIDRVAADPRLNRSYRGSNLRRIKVKLAELICAIAGGGCTYTGDDLRQVHANHHITERDFFGLVEILRKSLRRHHVRLRERNELLALLAPMERDVVDVRIPPPPPKDR
jgi:hemoglobin